MGSRSVVWGGMSIYRGGDWGCGGDGGCSLMMVNGWVSGSWSSWICMMGDTQTTEWVGGIVDEMGWGFRTFLGETPILSFLAAGFIMNAVLRISLKSLRVNTSCYGSCGNTTNVLFLCTTGCISSSSSKSIYARASFLYSSGPELGPTPSYLPFFFNISVEKT
jgi:hypothetical protein